MGCRCKIWLILFAFFICWYFMIHNVKYNLLSSPTAKFSHESNPVEIIDSNTTRVVDIEKTGSYNFSTGGVDQDDGDKNTDRDFVVEGEIDWIHNVTQMRALEHELDPLLEKLKPKPNAKVIEKKEDEKQDKRRSRPDEKRVNETVIDEVVEEMGKTRRRNRAKRRSCSGRYVYVHDLPGRFNDDILDDCRAFSKWQNMCPYIDNNGLGPNLGNPQRVLSRSGWYSTNQFMLEVIFHNRMKQYECLTNDSSIANAIYVPYYAGLDVWRYLFGHNVSSRDALSLDLAEWLRERPEWKTMSGQNHFLVAGRITWDFRRGGENDDDWGNKLMLLPEFKNMTILTIEKSPWHSNDFGIPYPTYFHPRSDEDIDDWQYRMRRRRRRALFSFAGAPRPKMEESIRDEVIEQCVESPKCRLLKCSYDNSRCYQPADVMRLFQSSVFCLKPPGDSYTRRSTFDSILAGCIPVFFTPGSAYVQYLWHLPKEFDKYSVLINEEDVKRNNVSIEGILSRIPARKVSRMRNEVIGLIPNVVYADPKSKLDKYRDAFDLSIKGVLERIGDISMNTSSFDFDERFSWKYYLFGSVEKHEWDHYFWRSMNSKAKQVDDEAN
ncbi:probable xyloglucan galactosyltransferase GT13 [Rutidosis leptorrhynchoides]|uniref:probable xyloglucan galactosyltransferase GT13 n=1 Tax=Rutidosis leptorrhynchoides TaxID=125765 RepID=UPI003A99A64C